MKINHHEPEIYTKKVKNSQIIVDIPEKTQELKKYNKNVDISGKVSAVNGANLNYNA